MGLLAKFFGRRSTTPSRAEMQRLTAYAQLAEDIGVELARGVDMALLPADKEQLKELIARVSLSS